jgi:hypothetical protein
MFKLSHLIVGACLCGPALAAEPSEASIEALLVATKAEAMMETIYGNLEQSMRQGMQIAATGRTLSDEQQRILQVAPREFATVMRQEFTWAKLRPVYVSVYKETFDQDEIDGLLAFYRSRIGQAFVDKMPQVMLRSTAGVQGLMAPLGEKMRAAMERALAEARLAK